MDDLSSLLASDHVCYIQSRCDIFTREYYELSDAEVRALEANGNSAENWHNVRKTNAEAQLQTSLIRQNTFHGKVVLGCFSASFCHDVDGISFASGVYNSALKNVVVLDEALVKDTMVLRDVLVDAQASIIKCTSVTGSKNKDAVVSANGNSLHVGVETGGRDLRIVADLSFKLGVAVVTQRNDVDFLTAYNSFVDKYVAAVKAPMAIVAQSARVRGCNRVQESFVGHFATIEDSDVVNSTILSTKEEPSVIKDKSHVSDSILQWNSTIEALSIVQDTFLCDTTHVERHGIVISSVIGPNTSIAEGEVTSSFVGPFVGFHHQALLIASIWPQGKGNVGYGANVGSNHTLKAPDQEFYPGEGCFFGLGCNIKFPCNFEKAPYSVVATAVTMLPQLLSMPFALINTPAHVIPSLSPAMNEIFPGWVLYSSVFTVLRNENKFHLRNKSKRTQIDADIFRKEIVEYMKDARAALRAAEGKAQVILPNGEAVHTDKQVRGLGKNYMRESSRREAITTYTFFIKLFALKALFKRVESGQVSIDGTVGILDGCCHELVTMKEEFEATKRINDCLHDLVSMKNEVAKKAADGKARDNGRGQRIIPDYAAVHKSANNEETVLEAQSSADDVKQRVAAFLAPL
ncbi:uncharacterized protein PHALS_09993 [Plasmopara halstedii]|uniref:DUF4954 domain-containing protein n=1 Tax=Plasmopara halstedii TaxID=4781 RepID=A0A0P1AGH3_PLAHL|nr:uncharacterized protein PHALS_09993 [Plasmopara halstedii]CEG39757.1 hypothetical protein PHALS_09993 [Plasmopara halstedii]|eukprot:XP_024576126.1 hypothetical protein PHALS_09993 [Plasmopara halstedii]